MSALPWHRALRRELAAAHYIPYTAHVAEAVVRTAAGEYVQVLKLGGASFESADDAQLNNWHERLNVTWRNIASPNVALWSHIIRRREPTLPVQRAEAGFAGQLAFDYQQRLVGETLMVNDLYLAVIYRPVTGAAPSLLAKALARRTRASGREELLDALDICEKLAQTLLASLARYEPERLGVYVRQGRAYSRLLEFLALLVNGETQLIPVSPAPINEVLASTRVLFGTEIIQYRLPTRMRLGAMLGIKEYPTPTTVGMFNALLSAPFPFVLTQSFSFLTKATAQGLLRRQQARMSNAGDFAVSQADELVEALDALTSNEFVLGDHHFTLQVLADALPHQDGDTQALLLKRLNDAVARARSILADTGMAVAREDLALEAGFWAQLPGNFAYRPRKAPITSRNFAAMVNFHNFPAGRATGNHWGEALSLLITSARSPYYFSLHASDPHDPDGGSRKDTGHTFICGPTGSGKTVLIGFLVALLARRGVAQVLFDKDRGLEILVRALGGEYLPLHTGEPTGFNPLRLPEGPGTFEFQKQWLRSLVRGGAALTPREEADLDHALRGTLALEQSARRLSRLIEFTDATRPEGIHARLAPWCAGLRGDYAWVFDNAEDRLAGRLAGQSIIGFDVTDFLDHPIIRAPVTLYLFHCVRQLLDGRQFVCWADEFSRLLADEGFEAFAKDGLKVWRKLNGVFCAATQSPSDALRSAISRTIIEQTATKVFFPNPDAQSEDYIGGFALTEREFTLIKERLEPGSRMFLVKQGHCSVVCELDLKGFDGELAVISGRASEIARLHRLMAEVGGDPAHWLAAFQAGVVRRSAAA
ncbi:MAG TPA: VirB4 family type IV secretion/conjugal transfer ATPase [Steroidobacteraceae bacterium]|jgi:type IV secretion system protein VirB4|nr:VirB4 family type IV secretion/conjugal transfer ATPase [Steroidobacteraceae bacterium]